MPDCRSSEPALPETKTASLLASTLRAMTSSGCVEDAAQAILSLGGDELGATPGHITLLDERGLEREVRRLDSDSRCTIDPNTRQLRERAHRVGRVVFDRNLGHTSQAPVSPDAEAPLFNVLFAPLLIDGSVVGLLGLGNRDGRFDEDVAYREGALAEVAAVALDHACALTRQHDREAQLAAEGENPALSAT
ncbi:MAG: GAF domain-containing protein [Actinobacteria bacterium]|nr:GAF domain-containing protein [Actinomycetota bacterium]